MYTRFFGLKQEPFSLAPDPRYLYMSKRHREALAHLLYGVGAGGGFVLLSGEIGAGKTTVCRCFLEQIPKRCNVAYIFNPKLTPIELMKTICDEFRIPPRPELGAEATVKSYVDVLNEFLLKTHSVGQNNVLIIDEAQMLSVDVLEQLRLLTNLETNEKKLLQIVLIGQPELRTMLERPDLEQLAQRVIARFHLKALSQKESEHYIRHRLSVAGMSRTIPFDRQALQRIFQIARGVPRRINLLCDRAMLGAYAHGRQQIDAAIVEKSAREVFGNSETVTPDRARFGTSAGFGLIVAAAAAIGALLAVGVYSAYRNHLDGAAAASAPASASAAAPASTAAARALPAASGGASAASAASVGSSGSMSVGASVPSARSGPSEVATAAALPPASTAARSENSASAAIAAALAAERAFAGERSAAASAPVVVAEAAQARASLPAVAAASAASIAKAPTATASAATAFVAPASAVTAAAATPTAATHPAAATTASAASTPIVAVTDLRAELHSLGSDDASAWRRLAALWHIDAGRGDPCAAALRQQVRCYKFAATLPLVRSLDRPGFITLRDEAGKSVAVVLVGLAGGSAVLARDDGGRRSVSLATLAKSWQGEFGTLWRLPAGYNSALGEGASGPLVDRLAAELAQIEGKPAPVGKQTFDADLRAMVVRFQTSHGLGAVGRAGPTTFMQLNRATGVDEPRLLAAGSAH